VLYLQDVNTHKELEICSPCCQEGITEAGDPQRPVFKDKLENPGPEERFLIV